MLLFFVVILIIVLYMCFIQAYQRLQIQQQMMQAQRNVSGPIRQQEQQVSQHSFYYGYKMYDTCDR